MRAIDKHPGLIARCSGLADVIAAVRFAREHGLLVAVRGGGHNVGGRALCDGGPASSPVCCWASSIVKRTSSV
jgi:FAD/FMN-containing dehydrogenase